MVFPSCIYVSMALIAVIIARLFLAASPSRMCALEPHVVLGLSARTLMDNHFVAAEMGLLEMDMNVRSNQKRILIHCQLRMKVVVVGVSPLLSDGLNPSMRLRCLLPQVVRRLMLATIAVSVLPIGAATKREDAFHQLAGGLICGEEKGYSRGQCEPLGCCKWNPGLSGNTCVKQSDGMCNKLVEPNLGNDSTMFKKT